MDKFDTAIINSLRQDARQSVSNIAEQVNLSRSAVAERIKKLELTGVIRGYQVLLSESQKKVYQLISRSNINVHAVLM